jgi:hypothetical protein
VQPLRVVAKEDAGYRYALTQLEPLALTGNRACSQMPTPTAASTGSNPDTESRSSPMRGSATAAIPRVKSASASGAELTAEGSQNWTFVDRSVLDADGTPTKLEINSDNAEAGENQVVFGTGGDEHIRGVGRLGPHLCRRR